MAVVAFLFVSAACTQNQPAPSTPKSVNTSPPESTSVNSNVQTLQRRPLHFPSVAAGATCPTTALRKVTPEFGIAQGEGPAYATIGQEKPGTKAVLHYVDAKHFGSDVSENQGWGGQKVLWFVDPHYQGLVLVRGHQIDGTHEMRFNQALESRLVIDTTVGGSPWPNRPSYTRLQAPGCYAYQVDGSNFSYIIVFRASLEAV
jgi:hypothetical protein